MTTWDDLAAVALLGTGRRRLAADGLPAPLEEARAALPAPPPGQDAIAVLDLAALAAAYRRAGVRPAPARVLPPAAPEDPRPVVAPLAASRLVTVLARGDGELLELWLATAAERGLRPPDRLLPALLDAATRQPAVAAALARAAGPRARWLAAYRPQWAAALAAGGDEGPVREAPPEDAWATGTPGQRLAWLRTLRAEDPGAARDLLEAGWAKEVPGERAALLGVLEAGLGRADEPFLERCLADRRGEVRQTAALLLTRLPGSAFSGRAAARALGAVAVERQLLRRRLVVQPPRERDEAMARDQVPAAPAALTAAGGGPAAWYLRHVVAAAPLHAWVALAPAPAELVALDVPGGWGAVLWCGWAEAALRERDGAWAEALLARAPSAGPGTHDVPALTARLLGLLPPGRRAELVARRLGDGLPLAEEALAAVPAPWPDRLAHVVVGRLAAGAPAGELWPLLALAARRLPAGWAPAVAAAGTRRADPAARRRYDESADLILFRSALLEEIR